MTYKLDVIHQPCHFERGRENLREFRCTRGIIIRIDQMTAQERGSVVNREEEQTTERKKKFKTIFWPAGVV